MAEIRPSCQAVIGIALSLVGSHYLWDATGATPGGTEGINLRRGAVSLVDPPRTDAANPAIFAARCSVDGLHVCGGAGMLHAAGFRAGEGRMQLTSIGSHT